MRGTFVAKRYYAYNNPILPTQQASDPGRSDPGRELLPMEMKRCIAWVRDNHNAVIAVCTVGILAVTAVYAVVATLQWCAMRGQLLAMQSANQTSRDQIRLSVRPWVGLTDDPDPIQSTPITFDQDGNASIEYQLEMKNFTGGAAQDVVSTARLLVTEDGGAIKAARQEVCSDNYVGHPERDMGLTLFPGTAHLVKTSSSSFERSKMVTNSYTGGVEGWLIGCIGYRDQFLHLYHYAFVFWYLLDRSSDTHEFKVVPGAKLLGKFVPKYASVD